MALYLNGKKLSGEPHNYSTDEQVVGTWIDGSTIYEKTYDLSSNPITIVMSWVTVATDPTVSKIVNAIALCGVVCENAIEVRVNNSDIEIERVGANKEDTRTLTYLTIQYTKSST